MVALAASDGRHELSTKHSVCWRCVLPRAVHPGGYVCEIVRKILRKIPIFLSLISYFTEIIITCSHRREWRLAHIHMWTVWSCWSAEHIEHIEHMSLKVAHMIIPVFISNILHRAADTVSTSFHIVVYTVYKSVYEASMDSTVWLTWDESWGNVVSFYPWGVPKTRERLLVFRNRSALLSLKTQWLRVESHTTFIEISKSTISLHLLL